MEINSSVECFMNSNLSFMCMKRFIVLIGIGIFILGIGILGRLSLIGSESIEKTIKSVPLVEPVPKTRKKCIQ